MLATQPVPAPCSFGTTGATQTSCAVSLKHQTLGHTEIHYLNVGQGKQHAKKDLPNLPSFTLSTITHESVQ